MLGHPTPDSTRRKIGAAVSKKAKAQGGRTVSGQERLTKSRTTKARWQDPEYRQRVTEARKRPEVVEKRRQIRLSQRLPVKMTSIERILLAEFKKRRLKFEMHKSMFRRFQPDFVFQDVRLIVEADGDYWHRQLGRDHSGLYKAAESADWTVWRFAEAEIRMHAAACGRAVARFVRSH